MVLTHLKQIQPFAKIAHLMQSVMEKIILKHFQIIGDQEWIRQILSNAE